MKSFTTLKHFWLLSVFILLSKLFYAVPACPYPIEYALPNGTTITIILKGDESISWAASEDGYTLLLNEDGYYEYAIYDEYNNIVLSKIRAKNIQERSHEDHVFIRSIEKDLRYSREQIHYMLQIRDMRNSMEKSLKESKAAGKSFVGEVHAPLILVGFQGKAFTKTKNDFELLMNQPNYTLGGAAGSVYDYFYASSYGQLEFTVDVYGPYTLSKDIGNYDNNYGGDSREMAKEAAQAAHDDGCDFSKYDVDNDGYVDGMHIIFAGYGQESGGEEGQTIWSHAWTIYNNNFNLDGKRVYRFSCSPEFRGNSGKNITYIGVIAHELSHVFGLPDLYDTDYEGSGGQSVHIGKWDIMASGSWNDGGRTPAYHSAWCRSYLGWVNEITLESPADITIPNAEVQGVTYRINTTTDNEYFLIENRQKTDWDSYIAKSGMLIYHVNENCSGWNNSCINCDPDYRGLYIKQANGGPESTSSNESNAPYPTNSNTSFTDLSTPNSKSWAGADTKKPITEITHNTANKTISFKFMGGGTQQYLVNLYVSPMNGGILSGDGRFDVNSQVTVTATPKLGYLFENWTKDGNIVSTDPDYTFTITENTVLFANFIKYSTDLISLAVTPGILTPEFSPDVTNYTVNVENSITNVSITGVAKDANSNVSGNVVNAEVDYGNNEFTVAVTAKNDSTKNYYINVIRAEPDNYEMAAFVWSAENNTKSFEFKAAAGSDNVKVNWGDDTYDIYSADGNNEIATKTYNQPGVYTVTIMSIKSNTRITHLDIYGENVSAVDISGLKSLAVLNCSHNKLTNLDISENTSLTSLYCQENALQLSNLYALSEQITANSNKYLGKQVHSEQTVTSAVPFGLSGEMTIGTTQTTFTVVKDGQTVVLDEGYQLDYDSETITFLSAGSYEVIMSNTAIESDFNHLAQVIIPFNVEASDDVRLLNIYISKGSLNPAFQSNVIIYNVSLPNSAESITITGTTSHPCATISGNVENASLNIGDNKFDIIVTAENGETTRTYMLTVTRSNTTNIDLINNDNYFTIYPNPVKDFLYIENQNEIALEVMLFSTEGKLLLQTRSNKIDLSGFADGMYIIRIGDWREKIIKR